MGGKHLTQQEKERIVELRRRGVPGVQIARELGRDQSTINKVLRRAKAGTLPIALPAKPEPSVDDVVAVAAGMFVKHYGELLKKSAASESEYQEFKERYVAAQRLADELTNQLKAAENTITLLEIERDELIREQDELRRTVGKRRMFGDGFRVGDVIDDETRDELEKLMRQSRDIVCR